MKSLYKFLVDRCYLIGNPWNGVALPKTNGIKVDRGRSLTQAQWTFVEQQLEVLPETSANRRLRFTLHLLYATGLRLAEVLSVRVDDLNWVSYQGDGSDDDGEPIEGWELTVVGKGGKTRIVPVPLDVIGELSRYLDDRGLDRDPEHAMNRGAYLIGRATDVDVRAPWSPAAVRAVDPKAGIGAGTLYAR